MSQTDFNDLHVAQGLEAVRDQIEAALLAARQQPAANDAGQFSSPQPLDDAPPLGSLEVGAPDPLDVEAPDNSRITLEQALQRFALAMPEAKTWDARRLELLKVTAAKAMLTPALYKEWLEHPDRRTVRTDDVLRESRAAATEGGGGLAKALQRYVYLYPTDGVWDRQSREIVPMSGLRYAIADCFDDWLKHPHRAEIDRHNLVFDPTQQCDQDSHINMFRGLPLVPQDDEPRCGALIEVLLWLCNQDYEVASWLTKWLAYPLQHVGAKMATAVMMHSETQGTGKSLLFDGVMRKIYGEYGCTLGQHQLESQYTDWRSQKLYGLFEEIFSRDQKYSHTGTVKQMITGETQRVEKKFVSGWEEANHMNAVFLSNEIQPFPVEPSDRRMLIIWPEQALPLELQQRAVAELAAGGAAAFYGWLLAQDLSDFGPHSKPPMTEAKERLIDFGRSGWDVFYREWERGGLEVPYCSCLAVDLYRVYCRWCSAMGEKSLSMTKFGGFISPRVVRRRDCHYSAGMSKSKGTLFQVGKPADGENQGQWLGQQILKFKSAMGPGDE